MWLMGRLPNAPSTLECPGCKKSMGYDDWCGHVIGCTQIQGKNASARHRTFKLQVKQLLADNRLEFDSTEPRQYHCEGCGAVEDDAHKAAAHRAACQRLSADQRLLRQAADGPDIVCENFLTDFFAGEDAAARQADEEAEDLLLDVTTVAATAPTHRGESAAVMFRSVEATKRRTYGAMAERRKQPLITLAATHTGHLSASTQEFVRQACVAGNFDVRSAWNAMSATIALGAAMTLRNAERQKGIIHVPRKRAPPTSSKGFVVVETIDAAIYEATPVAAPANKQQINAGHHLLNGE